MPVPLIKLNNGMSIPAIGLGTWSGTTVEEQQSALPWYLSAIEIGYRHFDTAYGYGTEPVVGQAIRQSKVPRSEIFVITKLPNHHHACVEKSLDESLERFGYDYFDLVSTAWVLELKD
jgi:glycerol 2-dehydrogenase (NADP+)